MKRTFLICALAFTVFSCNKVEDKKPIIPDYQTGLIVPKDWKLGSVFFDPTPTELPSSWDWRDQVDGGLTPIKNQASCGSCWAFGVVGSFENVIKIKDKKVADLSEQQLVSCNNDGYSCMGGWFAHDYHVNPGAAYEEDFPYVASNVRCKSPLTYNEKLSSWAYIGGSQGNPTIEQIKQAIYQYGPVAVTVAANSAMKAYKEGVFNGCTTGRVNHIVVLTGWNEDNTLVNSGGYYWIMRNSWAETWGDKGYMKIPYNCSRIGETATLVVYKPECSPMPIVKNWKARQTVKRGKSITLKAKYVPNVIYSWLKSEDKQIIGVSSSLTITPTKTSRYILRAESPCGVAEHLMEVKVTD